MHQTTATSRSHVAVFAFPFASHAAILLPIIHRLALSCPTTFFSFFSTLQSNKILSSTCKHYLSQPNVRAFDVADGVPEGYVFTGKHQEVIELFMKAGPVNLRKAVDTAVAKTGRKVSCLVSDAFLWFSADVAEELDVPWVACWASGLSSLSAHVYTDLIRERIGIEGIEDRLDEKLEFIPGMSKVQVRDLPEGVLFGNLQSLFSNMLHQMGRKLPQADAVFLNCFEELDLVIMNDLNSKFKKFLNVGPFTLLSPSPPAEVPDTNGCLSWLEEQKKAASVAYVSFGTVAKLPPGEVVAIAEALEAGKVPFIWSLQDKFQV
ncbi:hypothetical protein Pint_21758 [Pistacia integerrima]|uniref:Uncharacterized protein n=1 Tax=Pistacia integerrima TaxID=434235 RepID=A0ACC0X9D7_9ROSI|nr:hypothetical protein Pint_21758 [Pistacia integerrima]